MRFMQHKKFSLKVMTTQLAQYIQMSTVSFTVADAWQHKGSGCDQRPHLEVDGGEDSLTGAASGDYVPGVEGLEGIREASVASDSSSPALGAVHHICIAEAAHKHDSCTPTPVKALPLPVSTPYHTRL